LSGITVSRQVAVHEKIERFTDLTNQSSKTLVKSKLSQIAQKKLNHFEIKSKA
jgi:hypothetical protein